MKKIAQRGFTLVEMLIVIVILGIVVKVALPMLSSNNPQKLSVAAEETANLLRFALSEAKRKGGYVLVDGKSTAGQLKLYNSDSSANLSSVINDPLTKRAAILNVKDSAFSQGVTLTPQFRAGGSARPQLLIGPGLIQLRGFDGAGENEGSLQANSGVLLALDSQNVMVNINQTTGLVTLP